MTTTLWTSAHLLRSGAALRASKKTINGKPAILIATGGETISAKHLKSGDTLHCAFAELGTHFAFLLPAAGKDRYQAAGENPVDFTPPENWPSFTMHCCARIRIGPNQRAAMI